MLKLDLIVDKDRHLSKYVNMSLDEIIKMLKEEEEGKFKLLESDKTYIGLYDEKHHIVYDCVFHSKINHNKILKYLKEKLEGKID